MPSLFDIVVPDGAIDANQLASNSVTNSAVVSGTLSETQLASTLDISSKTVSVPAGQILRRVGWMFPEYQGNTHGATRYGRYDQVMDWSYAPVSGSSKIYFHWKFTWYTGNSSNNWCIHLGRVRDSTNTQRYYHTWNSGVYNTSGEHTVNAHTFTMSSWGVGVERNFTYEWARHPGANVGYVYQRYIAITEVQT